MEHKHAALQNQRFYERAADIMVSGSPNERLAILNQLWDAYRDECDSYDEHTLTRALQALDDEMRDVIGCVLHITTGFTLEQIIDYAKEMINHVTNETQNAASDPE
ncbi:hypothetical protein SDC9_40204 [bioreactor metagenome]|uniref:Uncharacterized protein n=1 Tax=bioreactor metagenome TaxID=1076179 RepID=A0A644VRV2_9ZZZZ